MNIATQNSARVERWSEPAGFYLRTGPFTTHVRTTIPALLDEITGLYEGHPITLRAKFADFHVAVERPFGLHRWYRPQVKFAVDGVMPFRPLPADQAMPLFEWGLNWCVANHATELLVIHAAAIEKAGRAVIMPGKPGAGKSTLTAGLVHRGWRLLSDELTLVSLDDGNVTGLARPISLKNESIDLIRGFIPGAKMSRVAHDTAKGSVAILKAPAESIARVAESARPTWIIFPKYLNGLPAVLERKSKAATLIEVAKSSFNYSIHGSRAFTVLSDIVDACACYIFSYADLNEAVEIFDFLAAPA